MVGELDVLNEWIPEQMQPGTVLCARKCRRNRRKGRSLLGRVVMPVLRHAGPDHPQTNQRIPSRHLRLGKLLGAILHPRSGSSGAQTVLNVSPQFWRWFSGSHCGRPHSSGSASIPEVSPALDTTRDGNRLSLDIVSKTAADRSRRRTLQKSAVDAHFFWRDRSRTSWRRHPRITARPVVKRPN